MNIAIMGAGAVAKAFMGLLESPNSTGVQDLKVKYVFNSRGGVYDEVGIGQFKNISEHKAYTPGLSIKDVKPSEIDVVVDLKSTDLANAEKDFDVCARILKDGMSLVSGNKGPVVYGYKRLKNFAEASGVRFLCGCACAAALPSTIVGIDAHAGSKIHSFEGIVNGTTNYIISKMEVGIPYDAALKAAQDEGIAEKNPAYDVEGTDTAIKTVMLANIIWETELSVESATVTGINKLTNDDVKCAAQEGKKIKLIGRATLSGNGAPQVTVAPEAISPEHLLYATSGKYKTIVFGSNNMGNVMISGSSSLNGAAAAVLRDIVLIKR